MRSFQWSEGANKTAVPYLEVMLSHGEIALPESNRPYLFYIADGSARLHTPFGILDYVSGQYSVSPIDMPFRAQVAVPSEQNDFLG